VRLSSPRRRVRGTRARRSRDRGARIGGTQAQGRVGTPAHRLLCAAPIAIRAVCRNRVDGAGETSSESGLFARDRSHLWDWSPAAGVELGDLPTIHGTARCDVSLFVRSTYRHGSAVRSWSRAWCLRCLRHNRAGPRPHEYGRCGDGESQRCGLNGTAAMQGKPWWATRGCNQRHAMT